MQIGRIMTLFVIYLVLLLAVFLLQRKMIYFPYRYGSEQQITLLADLNLMPWPSTGDYRGLVSQPPVTNAKGTVLVFHGNAGSAIHRTYFINALQRLGYRVIIAEYPGYGARSGTPSETSLIEDGIETARMASQKFKAPLFLCGESLGSGVVSAIVASGRVPVMGLLLITPFDAMVNVAQHHYWFLFAKWLLRDRFENIRNLQGFTGNTAVIMAGQDEVIPNRSTMALYDALPEKKRLWRFAQAGHNTLPMAAWNTWWQEAMQFIDR